MKLGTIFLSVCISSALALLSFFSIQIVAAQIATSSEPAATSTEVVVDTDVASSTPATPTKTATTTPAAQAATSTPPQASPPPPKPPPQDTMAREVSSLEDAYMQKTGRYLQVIAGNQLPLYESGTVSGKLGKNIRYDVQVDVYEASNGKGYQIYFQENGTVYSYGYGSEATARTYSIKLPVPTATSTATTMQ